MDAHLALTEAFDRIDDFLAVQLAAGAGRLEAEAVLRLQEAAGVARPERRVIAERLAQLERQGQASHPGAVLLGVLVGLFAAQVAGEGS